MIYNAEHFFGFTADPDYPAGTLLAAVCGGADYIVLCNANDGTLMDRMADIIDQVGKKVAGPHVDAGTGLL